MEGFCVASHLPYMAKLSSGKTFAVVHKIHFLLENFRGASGRGHHVLYTASDSRGKLLQSTEKLRKSQKFSHSKVLLYMVYVCIYVCINSMLVFNCTLAVEKKRHSRMKKVGKAEDTVDTHETLVSNHEDLG